MEDLKAAIRPSRPPLRAGAEEGAQRRFFQQLKRRVERERRKEGAPWVDLVGEGETLWLQLGAADGKRVDISMNTGTAVLLDPQRQPIGHIAPGADPDRPGTLRKLPIENKRAWRGWLSSIQSAGGVGRVFVHPEEDLSDPERQFFPGSVSLEMAKADAWLVLRIDSRGRWEGEWQQGYYSAAPGLKKLEQVPLDSVLPKALRGGVPPRFFVVKDKAVRVPRSALPVRVLPGSAFDGVVEVGIPAEGSRPVLRIRTPTESQARRLTPASLGFQALSLPQEEDSGVLIRPTSGPIRLEYIPPELHLSMEQLGYTAWVVSWVHRTMESHYYQTEEQLLMDGQVRVLAQIPVHSSEPHPPAAPIRLSRTPFDAERRAVLQAEFPPGTWSPRGFSEVFEERPGESGRWRDYLVRVSAGFPSLRIQHRALPDGALLIRTERQRIPDLLDSLRVVARLTAILMEKATAGARFSELEDPRRWPVSRLSPLALRPGAPETEREYLEKYLAIAALAYRPDPEGLAVLLRLLDVRVEEVRRPLRLRGHMGEVERVETSRKILWAEPHAPFRLAALAHADRRMEQDAAQGLVYLDERRLFMDRYGMLLTGETRDPVSSIRWAALQALARGAPPQESSLGLMSFALGILRQVRDDRAEIPALRSKAGALVEELKKVREQLWRGADQIVAEPPRAARTEMKLGFSPGVELDWLQEGARAIEPSDPESAQFFRSAMSWLSGERRTPGEREIAGLDRLEGRAQREDHQEILLLGLDEEEGGVPGRKKLELLRGRIRFRSKEDDAPRTSLKLFMNTEGKDWAEDRLDRIFPDARWLPAGRDGRSQGMSYLITSIGRGGALRLIPFREEEGRLGFRTELEPVGDLADNVSLLVALAAEILPEPPGEALEGQGPVGAGAEEEFRRIAREMEDLAGRGIEIIGRRPSDARQNARKWRELQEHQERVGKRLLKITPEQERIPEIRRWIPYLLMHQVALLVNRNLPLGWSPGDPIPAPDALEKDLYDALGLSNQVLKRLPPKEKAEPPEKMLRKLIRVEQARIVATLSAAGMFRNIETVQNALSDREVPVGFAFSLLSEAFRLHSESGEEPSPEKEASFRKGMAYGLMAALSPPEDFQPMDSSETLAFGPLLEFVSEGIRERERGEIHRILAEGLARRFGPSLQPNEQELVKRVDESFRDELLLASPAALLEAQGLAGWALSDLLISLGERPEAVSFRRSAEASAEEMAQKRRTLYRSYPAGRLAYHPALRWDPMQLLSEAPTGYEVVDWLIGAQDRMIPEPGIFSDFVLLVLRRADPADPARPKITRGDFLLGKGWEDKLRAYLGLYPGPFFVLADEDIRSGRMAAVITNVRPAPPDELSKLVGEGPPAAGAEEELKIREFQGRFEAERLISRYL